MVVYIDAIYRAEDRLMRSAFRINVTNIRVQLKWQYADYESERFDN